MKGFVTTGKPKHGERREASELGPLPREPSQVGRMERKLETKVGAAVYAARNSWAGRNDLGARKSELRATQPKALVSFVILQ